ncbi:MAG: winged helix DNA-binding protein [Bacteroidota bacterium]
MTKRIEDEIQSTNFRSEFHKASLNIIFTSYWISNQNTEIFKKYQLTPQQYNVLRILRGRHPEPCTLLSIRDRMIDRMSDVSRIVERLRLAGLVDRSSCEEDRRAVDVTITQKGLDLLTIMMQEETTMDAVMKNITVEEARTLNDILDKMRD